MAFLSAPGRFRHPAPAFQSRPSEGGVIAGRPGVPGLFAAPRNFDIVKARGPFLKHDPISRPRSVLLNISARTVNKHLEQIFIEIGVENSASTAAVATRALLAN